MTRLAYLVSHPIQYQAPMLRRIAREPGIDLRVLFMSDFSLRAYQDEGFNAEVKWDLPLVEGYAHEFLPQKGEPARNPEEIRNTGLGKAIARDRFDVLWSHGYASRTCLMALALSKARGIPTFVRSDNQRRGVLRGRFGAAKEAVVRGVFRLPSAFLTVGEQNADYYREMGVSDDRMFPVPYAIDNDRFRQQALDAAPSRDALRAELGLQPGRPVILFASKFQRRKRVLDLLAAWRGLIAPGKASPYLLYVGDGEQRAELEAAIRPEERESVRVLGFKNQTELPSYFDLCDVFVLPSDAEPWGLVVNEVMCASKAVIVTDEVGCHADLVEDGGNGRVFRVGDVAALTECLADVLSTPERSRAMGERSWEIVRAFDFEKDVEGLWKALAHVGHGRR